MKAFLLLCFGIFLCVGNAQDSALNFQDFKIKDSTLVENPLNKCLNVHIKKPSDKKTYTKWKRIRSD